MAEEKIYALLFILVIIALFSGIFTLNETLIAFVSASHGTSGKNEECTEYVEANAEWNT